MLTASLQRISLLQLYISLFGSFTYFLCPQIFTKERLNGHYGVGAFILSNFLSSFPFLVAVSAITGTITFYMVFQASFSRYVFFCLNLFGCIAMVESCMMIVASLVPNFLMGIITGAGVLVSQSIFKHPQIIKIIVCCQIFTVNVTSYREL